MQKARRRIRFRQEYPAKMFTTEPKRVQTRDLTRMILTDGLAPNAQHFKEFHREEKRELMIERTEAQKKELLEKREVRDQRMARQEVEKVADGYVNLTDKIKRMAIKEVRIG